jgi:hypothetical protein
MPRAVLTVTIDCECDKGPGWKTRRPMAFRGIAEGIGRRLHPLFRKYRATPTYLLSPEVIRDERSAELLAGLSDCELGTHLHGEYAEPETSDPDETTAFQRDYSPEIERGKLAYLTSIFERAFGKKPTSFRAGRFGIGPESLGILASLGYTVESSVTPFVDWSDKCPGLSFVGAPTQPYHPDPRDPKKPGASPLLEVPVTIRPRKLLRFLEPRWLRPTRGSKGALIELAREEMNAGDGVVVLNCMFHNVEILPGTSPYAATESEAGAILGRLEALLAFAQTEGIEVVGLSEVPEAIA